MLEAPIPADEAERLVLLKACHIMYTPAEEAFDDIARLAADLCGTEIALITLVDADRQWFKARVGVEQTGTARDLSFCGHCITKRDPLVVEDTLLDPRFADNPLVTGEPKLRFYAGVPLLIDDGSSVGALSVASRQARSISTRQMEALRRLARQVSRELRLRRDLDRAQATSPPAPVRLGAGSVIGERWQIVRELGRGGVGTVYAAQDAAGQRVAIKVLRGEWRTSDSMLERFAREARVLMRLTTPHVGKLLDVGNLDVTDGDLPYLVLEFLEGTDLDDVLARRGPVPFKTAFGWGADACAGVAEAHELGVIHRDLKPSNVFLARTASAAEPLVKVLDFGIASAEPASPTSASLTNVEGPLGSPAYMSPEQMLAASDVDARSDVWSMGVVLYQLVSGGLPFPGGSPLEVFSKILTRPPLPLRAHLKEDLSDVEAIILNCLRKKREDRYPSIDELAQALRRAAAA